MVKRQQRRAAGSGQVFGLLFGALLVLSGCSGVYQRYGYGHSAYYRNPTASSDVKVYLPPNAPSISQQFNPEPAPGAVNQGVHEGIDLFVPSGTAVIAPAPGTVVEVSHSFAYGNIIVIDHGLDQADRRLRTRYFHLKQQLVKPGERVVRGQRIGLSGMTGLLAGFPHLHFEVREENAAGHFQPRNPHLFWQNGVGRVTCYDDAKAAQPTTAGLTYPAPCR